MVTYKLNGSKITAQKRLSLSTLKETYHAFKKDFPNYKVGFSKFASLRPKHVVNDVIPRPPFLPSLQTRLVVIDLDIFKFKTRTISR